MYPKLLFTSNKITMFRNVRKLQTVLSAKVHCGSEIDKSLPPAFRILVEIILFIHRTQVGGVLFLNHPNYPYYNAFASDPRKTPI